MASKEKNLRSVKICSGLNVVDRTELEIRKEVVLKTFWKATTGDVSVLARQEKGGQKLRRSVGGLDSSSLTGFP